MECVHFNFYMVHLTKNPSKPNSSEVKCTVLRAPLLRYLFFFVVKFKVISHIILPCLLSPQILLPTVLFPLPLASKSTYFLSSFIKCPSLSTISPCIPFLNANSLHHVTWSLSCPLIKPFYFPIPWASMGLCQSLPLYLTSVDLPIIYWSSLM